MDDDELHTVMKYQNQKVMMWKLVRKPVNEGQTVKVMENVVGEYQFDDNSRQLWPPIDDKSLMINRPHADKIDVDEVRKDDLENVTPHIDLQFPIGVYVQNFNARRLKTLKLAMRLIKVWKPMWLRGRICKVVMLSYRSVQMWLMES